MGILAEAYYAWLMMWRSSFPKGRFSTDQIPDLSKKVAIVTGMWGRCLNCNDITDCTRSGGNLGIGREIVKVGAKIS